MCPSARHPQRGPSATAAPAPVHLTLAAVAEAGAAGPPIVLAHDPQTSGGLLAAVSADKLDAVVAGLEARGVPSWLVGQVEASGVAGPGVVLA